VHLMLQYFLEEFLAVLSWHTVDRNFKGPFYTVGHVESCRILTRKESEWLSRLGWRAWLCFTPHPFMLGA